MIISFCKDIYSKEALIKAAYQFTDRYYIHLSQDVENYTVEINSKTNDEDNIAYLFNNEMLAQTARQVILKQTGKIRTMIMARALASTVIENDGINVQCTDTTNDEAANKIFSDWFEENE